LIALIVRREELIICIDLPAGARSSRRRIAMSDTKLCPVYRKERDKRGTAFHKTLE